MRDRRVYLDNAATSFPKPPAVFEAMDACARDVGVSPGRGIYRESIEAARLIARCRDRVCRLIGASAPGHVIFTLNATDSLNLAIKGLVFSRWRRDPKRRVHAVTTAMEHNSILRPLNSLAAHGVEWACVPCDPDTGVVDPDDVSRAIDADTALVAVSHASNVTGVVQPIAEIGAACRRVDVPFLVDGSQSVGHVPIDVGSLPVDLLACSGHKGLLGPLGTGALYIRPGVEGRLDPLREGGTGSMSERDIQPAELPDRYESGSPNVIGIAGLSEGVAFLLERGVESVWAQERAIGDHLLARLGALAPAVRIVAAPSPGRRVGIASIVVAGLAPAEVAMLLEAGAGVLVRPGLHCAPRAHAALGTLDSGGTVRFSAGAFTTLEDVDRACEALEEILRDVSVA